MVEIGNKAPAFCLPASDGRTVSLDDFRGRWLVVYFYPKDFTPGCTKEAQNFAKLLGDFEALGVNVVGISPDSPERHCRFAGQYALRFPLLSDEDHSVAKKYGAWGIRTLYGKKYEGIIRSTFLIGPEGTLQMIWRPVRSPEKHPSEVLAYLKTLGEEKRR
jgi:peroxiredoxin Q/BCP